MTNLEGLPYCISFDTKEMPGKILAVKVDLSYYVMRDLSEAVRVDLSAHPLYPVLEEYVKANPSRK